MSAFTRFAQLLARRKKQPAPELDLSPAQASALEEASLLVEGKAVLEPPKPRRSTTASRREAVLRETLDRTYADTLPRSLNRAQRRALGLHKLAR